MTEDIIKKYLLGELDESAAERFEEECSRDEKLYEEFCIAESELIDEYLNYTLTPEERKSFENNYLISEARRAKMAEARIFLANIKDAPTEDTPPNAGGFWNFLENQLLWRLAFIGLLLTLCFGVLIYLLTPSEHRIEIARTENPPQISETQKPSYESSENSPVALNTHNLNTAQKQKAQNSNAAANVVNRTILHDKKPTLKPEKTARFVLRAETLRDEGEQSIRLPLKTAKVNFKLELPAEAQKYESYQVTVKTAEGETIAMQTDLKDPNVTLPASQLQKQTYVIFLAGKKDKNSPESIAEFTFRVRR